MHELSLFNDLMRKIQTIAKENEAQRVLRVHVTLGALSHLSPEHFREHFAQLSPGTVAENAELLITVEEDINHPNAQEVMLESVELEA